MKPAKRKRSRNKRNRKKQTGGVFVLFWQRAKWYVIAALVLGIIVRVVMTMRYGALVAADMIGGYDWVIGIVIAAWFGHSAYRRKPQQKIWCVLLDTGLIGVLFGIVAALLDLAMIRTSWAAANILLKPLLLFAIYGAVGVIGFVAHKNGNSKKLTS